jgi:uncharacterized protein (DUF2236 family)
LGDVWYGPGIVRTMASVLPTIDEVAALVPKPHSILWRCGDDARLLAAAGYTLLLQVAHPMVGAAVKEHSNFRQEPWKRLMYTLDYVYAITYGGPERAAAAGRHLRDMHKAIKGVDASGRRYHALDPAAYAWVQATLFNAIVVGHERFGRPLRPDQVERLYIEHRNLGRIIGVRASDLPPDLPAFRAYFDAMVADVLEDNETVHDVLDSLRRPTMPAGGWGWIFGDGAWRALRIPIAHTVGLATVGLLPPVLRERFGLTWSAAQEHELRALGAASRAATPLLPRRLRHIGQEYLRWRDVPISHTYGVAA